MGRHFFALTGLVSILKNLIHLLGAAKLLPSLLEKAEEVP